jgi:hypothetical protein
MKSASFRVVDVPAGTAINLCGPSPRRVKVGFYCPSFSFPTDAVVGLAVAPNILATVAQGIGLFMSNSDAADWTVATSPTPDSARPHYQMFKDCVLEGAIAGFAWFGLSVGATCRICVIEEFDD